MDKSLTLISKFRADVRLAVRTPIGCVRRFLDALARDHMDHQLAVCAIFREEAPFLDEWIRFHIGSGASHFYLYNNFSSDNFEEVLKPWQEAGFVTLVEWPVPVGQTSAYDDCIKRFKNAATWIAFIDIDEFLFSPEEKSILPVLDRLKEFPGVEVWQYFFGSNGHIKRPSEGVVQSFTRRAPISQTTAKSIVNPRMVYKVGIHRFKYWAGHSVSASGTPPGTNATATFDHLRINHYWSRSLEDLKIKIKRGDCSISNPRDPEWHLRFESTLNQEEDFTIQKITG